MERIRLRREALAWREVGEEAVALDLEASMYFAANASGTLLWKSLAAGTTREELVSCLVHAYGVDAISAAADVDEFLTALDAKGLLEAEPELD